ncbi:DUF6263 family protein [Niabella beijingensis]|uniref:DUF6263 family protein n=1 Tax=Niabella beijingensis TaxID=2872700 RepID=UPI001CBF9598|nr:DUF6263 family protein [Niabella beijingensis]MBZ4190464.1 hypothetical protein [Niabella beijingensis]
MKKITLALFSAAMLAASALQAQKITLRFSPANGSRYDVATVTAMNIKQTVMGQPANADVNNTVAALYEIADAGADKNLTMTYGAVKTNMSFMGKDISIDSESPDTANAGNKMFRSIKGQKITATIASDGSVKKVEGFEAIKQQLNADNSPARQMTEEMFSDATIKSLLEQSLKMYPKEAVSAGSTWASTVQIEKPYKLTMQNNYTLKKTEGGKSFIDVTGKVGTNGATKMQQQGMEVEINLDGTVTGTLTMDNASGITDTSELTQLLKGTAKVQGMEVPMEITVKTTIDMKKL